MNVKKKIVETKRIEPMKEYVLLIKGTRRHKMQKQFYEKGKEGIHKDGWKLATIEQAAKTLNIEFTGAVEVVPEKKERKKKIKPVIESEEKTNDFEE